jgi:hypothetical protein
MTRWSASRAAWLALMVVLGMAVSAATASASARRACTATPHAGRAECFTLIRTGRKARTEAQVAAQAGVKGRAATAVAPTGYGYGPSDLQSAYNLASAAADDGAGATVALVDAYNDPDAASDLNTYRTAYGLPACTVSNGCFQQLNQNGQRSPLPTDSGSTGWATEESLDIDMVSAICPQCKITLVEAESNSYANLGTAVNAAVSSGAKYVSNSYGGSESSEETTLDSEYYDHPGEVITASAGDSGYGVEYPAASPDVVAVGGTSLTKAGNARGWSESVWGSANSSEGTGSGCSAYEPKPSWQSDGDCPNRINNDVSADADPNTGVAVYDSYDQGGWLEVGGTSASSPMIAAVYALAGPPPSSLPAETLYEHPQDLYDVTTGENGSCGGTSLCNAEVGYDAPTGLGTPDGLGAFTTASSAGPVNSVAPTISGTPQDGKTLNAKHGTWSPSKNVKYAYLWEACSGSCTPISNATKATLKLKAAQVGQSITVEVTATDAAGSTTISAAQVGPVTSPGSPGVTKGAKISGTPAPGKTLTGSATFSSPDTLTYSYEWELCPGQSPSGCAPINGVTAKTLRLTAADAGKYVEWVVTATDQEGESTTLSAYTSQTVS